MEFRNNSSQVKFIGNQSLEEVIEKDSLELKKINGSFDEISKRMTEIVNYAKNQKDFPVEFDRKVTIINYISTRGLQFCPFDGSCEIDGYSGWNEDVIIKSRTTNKELTINLGTAHLAKEHHLLEKENKYGISPKEFYESFM